MKYYIPQPPAAIFSNNHDAEKEVLRENKIGFLIDRIEYKDGIQVYYKDIPFPRKGFPTPEAVAAINIVKRVFIETIKTLTYPQFWVSWGLSLFTRSTAPAKKLKWKVSRWVVENLLLSFNRICYDVIARHILKPEFMTPLASEFQGLIYTFLVKMNIEKEIARQFAFIFGTLLEYDNAYRYRLEDLFSETTKEKMIAHPRKEVKRLFKIYCEREKDYAVRTKFKKLGTLISIPLLIPMVKLAIRKALQNCEFERLQLDETDRYWCLNRHDYDFFGKSYKERTKDFKQVNGLEIII